MVALGSVLRQRKQVIQIDDTKEYKRCRVQLHAQGVMLRDRVMGAEVKTKSQQVCRASEFLVAEIDAKVGGFGIVPAELDGAIVSSHYFLFAVDETQLDIQFLDYYVRTQAFQDQVQAQGSTNYAAIRPADVLGYILPLPPLDEQRRIVARIVALAARIEEARGLRREAVVEAEALLESALRETFTTLDSAEKTTVEGVCEAIIDNLHSNPVYSDEGVPCVRSQDIGWGHLNLSTAFKTTEDEYRRRTVRGEPRAGDVVLVREGDIGRAAVVDNGQRFSLGQRVMMLRLNRQRVLPKYFLYQLLSPVMYEEQILPLKRGTTSFHLNIGSLRKLSVWIGPISKQQLIVTYLDSMHTILNSLKQRQAETETELDAILPSVLDRAFQGEL